jgi:hypothetical protein
MHDGRLLAGWSNILWYFHSPRIDWKWPDYRSFHKIFTFSKSTRISYPEVGIKNSPLICYSLTNFLRYFSLAVSDFLCSCFLIPLNLMYFNNEGRWTFGFELCCLHKIFGYGLVMHASILICLIAVNRFTTN